MCSQSRVIAALPEGEEKHGFGLVRAAYMLIGSAGSVTTGALADQIRRAWATGANIAVLCVGIAAFLINSVSRRGL